MPDASAEQILGEIEDLKDHFTNCRAHFPYLRSSDVGMTRVPTDRRYSKQGYRVTLCFAKPLAVDDIERLNAIARWINQNVIVRLFALMQYHGMYSKSDRSIDGQKELDLLKRLRNVLAHKSGKYDSKNAKERRLAKDLMRHFKLENREPTDFRLDIDRVIDPLFEGCKKYVRGKLSGV